MNVQNPLAAIRQKAGFRYAKDASEKLGVTVLHVWKVEGGAEAPSDALVARMADLYGATPEDVMAAHKRARRKLLERQLSEVKS